MAGPPPGYKEVSERIQDFRKQHPEGSLQAEIVPSPFEGFVCVKAYAYRTPDDPRPGVGLAWEPVPGKTNFTRDSELMNAETSAWGRAIIAVGASDAKHGIASANEVRNRQSDRQVDGSRPPRKPPATPSKDPKPRPADDAPPFDAKGSISDEQLADIAALLIGEDAPDTLAAILKWAGVDKLEDLSSSQADVTVKRLSEKDAERRLAEAAGEAA